VDVVEVGPRTAAQVVTVEWGRWWHIYTANGINQKYVNKQNCVRGGVGGGGNPRGRGQCDVEVSGWMLRWRQCIGRRCRRYHN
jgi:hypothetical protein